MNIININKFFTMANKKDANKEIIALSDVEHCRMRPTMYIGTVAENEEDVRIIKDGAILMTKKTISIGFYTLLNEILDNAFDEAKRIENKMKEIIVEFDSKTNRVTVTDTGDGFLNASTINKITGITNVETGLSVLRAGSNFKNDNIDETLIGTNGIGAAVVNMLSDEFEVTTTNLKEYYFQKWINFKCDKAKNNIIRKKTRKDKIGTSISFIPRKETFINAKWDYSYIEALMIFRNFIKQQDTTINNLSFIVKWDGVKIDLNKPFIPKDSFEIKTKIGSIYLWKVQDDYCKQTSFINTALCTGKHQSILQDFLNEIFDYKWAHWYCCSMMIINLPPKCVRFESQNKIKLASGKWEILPFIENYFFKRMTNEFVKSDIYKDIKKTIDIEKKHNESRELKKQLRHIKKKIVTDKYFAPSESKGTLFIVEGGCISADTLINVWRNNIKVTIPISDVHINDKVITHNHRFKIINNVQNKLKETVKIETTYATYVCGKQHPFYVYNKKNKQFNFVSAANLNLENDRIVRSQLGLYIGYTTVIDICDIQEKDFSIKMMLDNNEIWKNTSYHKYCIIENDTFKMIEAQNINVGHKIAIFDKKDKY